MSRQSLSQDLTVGRIGRHVAATDGGRIALDDGSRRVSYRELDRQAAALAGALAQIGVARGDVVSAYLPNCIEYVITVLAVARAGAIFSPLNPRFRSGELGGIVAQSKPRVVVVDDSRVTVLRDALGAAGLRAQLVVCGDESAEAGSTWSEARTSS